MKRVTVHLTTGTSVGFEDEELQVWIDEQGTSPNRGGLIIAGKGLRVEVAKGEWRWYKLEEK